MAESVFNVILVGPLGIGHVSTHITKIGAIRGVLDAYDYTHGGDDYDEQEEDHERIAKDIQSTKTFKRVTEDSDVLWDDDWYVYGNEWKISLIRTELED